MGCLFETASAEYLKRNSATFNDAQGMMCAWIYLNSVGTFMIMSSSDELVNDTFVNFFVTASILRIGQRNADILDYLRATTVFIINRWYHVAIVSDGTTYYFYINGNLETPVILGGANTGDWFADTAGRDNFIIGANEHSGGLLNSFDGIIFDARVYNNSNNHANRIKYICEHRGCDNDTDGLIGRWKLDERPEGTVVDIDSVRDISGQDFHMNGVIGGTPEYRAVPMKIIK